MTTTVPHRPRVTRRDELNDLQLFFDNYFRDEGLERVLDVGAGFKLPLDIPRSTHLVALDQDAAALKRNENADEKVLGHVEDLGTNGLTGFDAVICWWVLEHLPSPGAAIAKMATALRPGGLLVVGVPYFWGFKALATKLTPFWFHVYMARRDDPLAGSPGYGPYPTYLRREIAPNRLDEIAAQNGLIRVYGKTFSLRPEERLPEAARIIWTSAGRLVLLLSGDRYNPLMSEHVAVFRRD
jgi:SAM-dependent methyltransferase